MCKKPYIKLHGLPVEITYSPFVTAFSGLLTFVHVLQYKMSGKKVNRRDMDPTEGLR